MINVIIKLVFEEKIRKVRVIIEYLLVLKIFSL